jgi:hypothetical protein
LTITLADPPTSHHGAAHKAAKTLPHDMDGLLWSDHADWLGDAHHAGSANSGDHNLLLLTQYAAAFGETGAASAEMLTSAPASASIEPFLTVPHHT